MILGGGLEAVELPEIGTAVYGFSYESKELTGKPAEEVIDGISGATLADTVGYVTAILAAAELIY